MEEEDERKAELEVRGANAKQFGSEAERSKHDAIMLDGPISLDESSEGRI